MLSFMEASFLTYVTTFRDSVGDTRETTCFTRGPDFSLNWRHTHYSLYRLSVITIDLIADAPARDIVMLTLAITILSIVILLLKLSLKVMGPTVWSSSYLLLESHKWLYLLLKSHFSLKHMY